MKNTQISAVVSDTTKEMLDRHVRATGAKKGHVIEVALRHHLMALLELPLDVILNPRIVVSRRSGEEIIERMASKEPAAGLRDLMARDGD